MGKFICKQCGYKTENPEGKKRCPYCDKVGLEEEQDAEEILKEIEEILK